MLNGVSGTHNKSAAHIAPGGVRALGAFHTRFGDRPGSYTIGVSYLSQQGNWITIPQVSLMQAGATPDQLRASSEVYLNLLPHAATRHSTAKAWLWAGRPTVEDYVAESGYQYSSAGGRNNRVVRLGVGQYRVELPELATDGGTVHVTAYGGNHHAKVVNWAPFSGTPSAGDAFGNRHLRRTIAEYVEH
jgi:hypothetical protein